MSTNGSKATTAWQPLRRKGEQVGSFFDSISPNGRYVVFSTFEDLLPSDEDLKSDIYLVDMGPQPQPEGRASASAARPGRTQRHRWHRRLRLVSAESIAPKMRIAARGTFGDGGAHLKLGCPKAETSGPCHGRARLLDAGLPQAARERAASGSPRGTVPGSGSRQRPAAAAAGSLTALARVRGADMLHNAARVHATVELRHTP